MEAEVQKVWATLDLICVVLKVLHLDNVPFEEIRLDCTGHPRQ
jgi:hypothetical protein